MNFEDKQEYEVLKAMIENDNMFNRKELNELLSKITGESTYFVTQRMIDTGLIDKGDYYLNHPVTDRTEQRYKASQYGINKYETLRKQGKTEIMINRVLIWTLIAAVVGAIAGVIVLFRG